MDSRTALKRDTTLRFDNGYEYTITDELARGGSSIVYNAFYVDNLGEKKTVRIKECYPFKCDLKRGSGGELLIPSSEEERFAETKEKTLRAYRHGNGFFHTDGLTNLTANTYNIFEANNTLYIVSAYTQGQELSYQRYPMVKDSIAAVKSVANAILKIHNEGFLYLDIKPSNILTLEGTTELVQLFDFDTVVPISDIADLDDRISYTKGFAALELQAGDHRRIGRHTDVYGIGALLFYMLFGRVPDAFDCETDAIYDFSKSKLSGGSYQDALTFRLADFFHHTLADYYLDRFSNMETVVEKLSELQALADLSARYVISTKLNAASLFLGRTQETEWITAKLTGGAAGCFFVTGMGGIGKSTLLRRCIRQCRQKLDAVLYLNYLGSIEKTICDDYAVHINSVQKDKSETDTAYFDRKLSVLRELSKDKSCVLVIDNYTGDMSDAFPKLLQLGWILVFVTRDKSLCEGYETLEVGPFSEESDRLALFSKNLCRELTENERRSAASILRSVNGHTLVVELIAKQIGSPICSLSIEQAAQIVAASGFSSIAAEKVNYQKDSICYHNTVKQIISDLFEAGSLSSSRCVILKVLSLFGQTGVCVDQVCEMLGLENKEDISVLYHQGWIYVDDTLITMHPVIAEVVSNWELSEAALAAATKVIRYLDIKLRVEAQKEEYPKNLLRYLNKDYNVHESVPDSWLDRRLQRAIDKNGSVQAKEAYISRVNSYADRTATDHGEVEVYLRLAMAALEGGKRETKIYSSDSYRELLYYTIINTPYENESFIREKSEEFIALFHHNNERMLLKIYQELLEVLYDHGEFEEAKRRIRQARAKISGNLSPDVWGRFYYVLAGYYDSVLGGAYDAETAEETQVVRLLLNAVNKAIRWLNLSGTADARILLGECYRLKALVLIRSGLGKKKRVFAILEKVRKLIDRYAQPNSRLVRDYYMTLAWYHTYLDEDFQKTRAYMFKAHEITGIISTSELAKIDDQLCPMANIMLEWQEYEDAEQYLRLSIAICGKHQEIAAYQRRQAELLGHLLQVYFIAGEYEKCREAIAMLNDRSCKDAELNIEQFVPTKIREAVFNQSTTAAPDRVDKGEKAQTKR
jgi:serine/threonine protein kinase